VCVRQTYMEQSQTQISFLNVLIHLLNKLREKRANRVFWVLDVHESRDSLRQHSLDTLSSIVEKRIAHTGCIETGDGMKVLLESCELITVMLVSIFVESVGESSKSFGE
jgi:hypothetical protein